MIIFLYGTDSYRIKQARDELIKRYKLKYPGNFNLSQFNALGGSKDSMENVLKSYSFFNGHKLIVGRNYFSNKSTSDTLSRYITEQNLSKISDITLLITEYLSEKELRIKNAKLFELLSDKSNHVKTLNNLEGTELEKWIGDEFIEQNCSIDKDAIKYLATIVGNDAWTLSNEISKLSAYKKVITKKDINELVTSETDISIFELIDALGAKNRPKGLELLYKELKTGRDPYYILTMIIYQLRNMVSIKDLQKRGQSGMEIGRKTKLHPFVIKKSINSPFTMDELISTYKLLLRSDSDFKTGKTNLEDSLYNIFLS